MSNEDGVLTINSLCRNADRRDAGFDVFRNYQQFCDARRLADDVLFIW